MMNIICALGAAVLVVIAAVAAIVGIAVVVIGGGSIASVLSLKPFGVVGAVVVGAIMLVIVALLLPFALIGLPIAVLFGGPDFLESTVEKAQEATSDAWDHRPSFMQFA